MSSIMPTSTQSHTPSSCSPIKKRLQGSLLHQAQVSSAPETREALAEEMKGLWLGPMPVEDFLEEFVPLDEGTAKPPSLPKHFETMPASPKRESDMYDEFVELLQGKDGLETIIPHFKVADTSNIPDQNSRSDKKVRPDLSMYEEDVGTSTNRMQFDKLELFFEFKRNALSEPFDDPEPFDTPEPFDDPASEAADLATWEFERSTDMAVLCRGQLATYATEMCARQHRTAAFAVFLGEPYVRFIRFDRSGAIVSRRFNYREDSQLLVDFLWRFSHLSPAQRGHDELVRLATEEEVRLAKPHLATWKPPHSRPFLVLDVPVSDEDHRKFVVWGSMAEAESLTGRATRAWPAFDLSNNAVVFLKDTWRPDIPEMEQESSIIQELNKAEVRHVPVFDCGGDLSGQITRTDSFASSPWVCGVRKITPRKHNRFTVKEVGTPLKKFKSSKQLMRVVYDAFVGHKDAYEKCRILHRDVSGANILILENGRGLLNDWDMSRKIEDMKNGPRQFNRTGTWQFMSTLLLRDPGKLQDVQDDMESFVNVVLYYALRYLNHTRRDDVRTLLSRIFDDYVVKYDGSVTGGEIKSAMYSEGLGSYFGGGFHFINNRPLTKWFSKAAYAIAQWHQHVRNKDPDPIWEQGSMADMMESNLLLSDYDSLCEAWDKLLDCPDYPIDDEACDKLGPRTSISKAMPQTASQTTSHASATSHQSAKRSRDETPEEGVRTKKQKAEQSQVGSSLRESTGCDDMYPDTS